MKHYGFLTLDLKGNADDVGEFSGVEMTRREVFYKLLAKANWKKINDVDTLWICSFSDAPTEAQFKKLVSKELQDITNITKMDKVTADFALCGHVSSLTTFSAK